MIGKYYPFEKEVVEGIVVDGCANCVTWLGRTKLLQLTGRGLMAMIMKLRKSGP
jgi:hypothetical protein